MFRLASRTKPLAVAFVRSGSTSRFYCAFDPRHGRVMGLMVWPQLIDGSKSLFM